ncbi:PARP-type domain-containing protein (Fragment) [Durusdinium trenchii]|uniref:PARP-type domain-containing protein n=1 Tax=Durusdinium trenchii TaxID=1381693 RepID=A0ABP0K9W3_9DINO
MFKLERRILVDRKEDRRLAFRQKCILHALCLVRRPAVLSVEGFWTTLVRLAHLFEQQSFKKKFSMAMVQVLSKPGIPVTEFPTEMHGWQQRAAWIHRSYDVPSKAAKAQLKEFLDFANGDSRTMRQLEVNAANNSDTSTSQLYATVQSLLSDDAPTQDGLEHVQALLDELLDNDLSYSVQNSVRRRLVCQHLATPGFLQGSLIIESIISAIEPGINTLFKHTANLTKLTALGSNHPEYNDLKGKCKESFLRIISGDFGEDLMRRTLSLLDGGLEENLAMGMSLSPERMRLLFQVVCACVSDLWRRLVYEAEKYPVKVFSLLRLETLDEFVQTWDGFLDARSTCGMCVDLEFTEPLLATFGRFVKKPAVARETSLLQSVIRNHGRAQAEVSNMTLPPQRASVRKPLEHEESKRQRLEAAQNRHVRALSGWNVFQREKLAGKQLELEDYESAVKQLSRTWREMSDEQKEEFEIQAVHEQNVRGMVSHSALPTKEQIETDDPMLSVSSRLAEEVGKKGLKKISAKRLAVNQELYNSHCLWSCPTQLGDGNLVQEAGHGALKAHSIDVSSPDNTVEEFLQNSIHKQCCPDEIASEIDRAEASTLKSVAREITEADKSKADAAASPLDYMLKGIMDTGESVGLALIPNYWLTTMILESSKFQLPQSRKRLYIVMVRKDICDEAIVKNLGEVVGKVLPHAMQEDGKESSKSKSIVKTFKKELGVAPHGSIAAYSESILNKAISAAESLNKRERDCLDVHYATLVAT